MVRCRTFKTNAATIQVKRMEE